MLRKYQLVNKANMFDEQIVLQKKWLDWKHLTFAFKASNYGDNSSVQNNNSSSKGQLWR